jgi:7-keto-8-aminopelargonate synthetase-like enzyme
MKLGILSLALALLLVGCATNSEKRNMKALYSKYDTHCREHARQVVGEADEHARYEECMAYFINKEETLDCPYCVIKHQ